MTALPYGLFADAHAHNWTAFASLNLEGVNTRLAMIIHEIDRCCEETQRAGGDTVVIAGDLFHVRGSVDPSVFNPVRDCFTRWNNKGLQFDGIPGNHDLKSDESCELGSSMHMLHDGDHVQVVHEPELFASRFYLPWTKNVSEFFQVLDMIVDRTNKNNLDPDEVDLICHIGIDGTLSHMPDHGVGAERLAKYGFKRVFSGHYHHYKEFDDGVYSIGALTHQTWSDVGTRAGFLIVHPDRVQRFASHAPSFIDIQGDEDEHELPLIVDGNFVRAKIGTASASEVKNWRESLMTMGAKGVLIQSVPDTAENKRAGVSAKSMSSVDKSIADYCTEKGYIPEIGKLCQDILTEAQT